MATVGVRELRQRASELLRRVEAGETIEVTDRGRPVAVLAPLPDHSPIERLRATGDLVPSQHDLDDLADPLPLGPGQEPPSSMLARLRRDER
jgi:prevent-host-death family protein